MVAKSKITEKELNAVLDHCDKLMPECITANNTYSFASGVKEALNWAFNIGGIPFKVKVNCEVTDKEGYFDIWMEGYIVTGGVDTARLLAQNIEADLFKGACIKYIKSKEGSVHKKLFNEEKLSIWGCRLYDNETDATREYG